jgi:hypothetical protein
MPTLKVGELRDLDDHALLLLAARCAMRVEPWLPPGAKADWKRGLDAVCRAGVGAKPRALARALSDRGAMACNRLARTDEPLGECMNYATETLCSALEATLLAERKPRRKAVIDATMYAKSIGAVLAHAGRVTAPRGADAVDFACDAMWDAIRADVAALAGAAHDTTPVALRALAPLWPRGKPRWVP